ncbi:hypothetical protein AB0G83_13215 [Streptomyces klenkii]|uniref:hypothetical protein n=1 Tax=Streptomyces klenkii TaxID=1420899 RepID=UPI0033EEAAC8
MSEITCTDTRTQGLQGASRSAYLRLFALQRDEEPATGAAAAADDARPEGAPDTAEAQQWKTRRSRMAIVDKLRSPVRMWPESPYPDFWVEYARNGRGWHERFPDKATALLGADDLDGLLGTPEARLCSPHRVDVGEAYTRLRSSLGEGPA